MSDEDLIKLSLSAAPEAIAKDATVVAMDHDGKIFSSTSSTAITTVSLAQGTPDRRCI
jgi:hypothetical protein